MTGRERLDVLMVDHGLVETRARARALVLAGHVRVDGVVVSKAGTQIKQTAVLTLSEPEHPYVSRGGIKLAHALDTFLIEVSSRTALDIGASTGGFTDSLLQRGAKNVVALDVGHGQLDWKLRQDPRVVVVEGLNARTLRSELLPAEYRQFDLITVDVSFISLTLIIPCIPPILNPDGNVVLLIKPQFEAGREEVGKKGVITETSVQKRVVNEVAEAANKVGLRQFGTTPSPIKGAKGNQEFFIHLRP